MIARPYEADQSLPVVADLGDSDRSDPVVRDLFEERGDVLAMHGRTPFTGPRRVLAAMG